MPRFAIYRFAGQPPQEPPLGMNELLSIQTARTSKEALRKAMRACTLKGMKTFNSGSPVTHLGVYSFPPGYSLPMQLVLTYEATPPALDSSPCN